VVRLVHATLQEFLGSSLPAAGGTVKHFLGGGVRETTRDRP
jgi:hypothetical protein